MKIDSKVLEKTAQAIAQIDTAAANERCSELQSEIAKIDAKIQETRQDARGLARQVRDYVGPAAQEVADALMANVPATDAAELGPTEEELRTKKLALDAAISELNTRLAEKKAQVAEVQSRIRAEVSKAVSPLVEAMADAQREAAETLAAAHAGLTVLQRLTKRLGGEIIPSRYAIEGVTGTDRLLGPIREIASPAEVLAAIKGLDDLGPAFAGKPRALVRLW